MLKIKFKQLPYTMFFIVLLITLGILCSEFNRTQARQLKVDVQTVQNGSIQDRISKKVSGNKISYAISLFNSSNNDQNLSTIIVSIKPDELIPSGTPYMIGADKQGVNGWMKQLITGTSNSNDKSVKYLTNSFQNSQANELSIYNTLGQMVFTEKIQVLDNDVTQKTDLRNLNKNIFVVQPNR